MWNFALGERFKVFMWSKTGRCLDSFVFAYLFAFYINNLTEDVRRPGFTVAQFFWAVFLC